MNAFKINKFSLVIIILLIGFKLNAQNKFDTSYNTLQTINLISRNIQLSDSSSPNLLTKINNNQLTASAFRTTPEALMGASGVFVQKTNHGGGSAFIRGLTGNQTLILIDGIRLNNATYRYGPNQYLNTIDIFSLDKIEVAKGTGSVAYGSDAMGGTILLQTKEKSFSNSPNWEASSLVKYISHNMEKTNRTEIGFSNKKITVNGGITLRNYGDLVGGNGVGTQNPSGYNENAYDIKLKIKTSSKATLIIASQNQIQNKIPIYHKIILENYKINQTDKQVHRLHYLKYSIVKTNKWLSKIIFSTSMQQSIEQRSNERNNSSTLRKEADTIFGNGLTAEIISKPAHFWTMNTGFDYYQDKINSKANDINTLTNSITIKRGLYPNDAHYKSTSLFNLHQFKINKFTFETGLRYNIINIKLTDIALGNIAVKPSAMVYNTGIHYQINKYHQFYSSLANGYRAPNIDDMGTLGIVDFRYEIPSYDLKPEKSFNTELGYKYSSKETSLNVAVFNMQLSDIITRVKVDGQVINGYTVYNKQNVESSYIKGFEISFSKIIHQNFNWTSNITYTFGQNLTKNEPMRRIPPLFGQNKLEWKKNNLNFAFTHVFAGKQDRLAQGDMDDNRIGKLGTPNWNVINFDASIKFQHINLNTSLINILNEKYKTHGSGVYGMGRALGISVQWKF